MLETIKKYWWAVAIGVYLMFFNKPARKRRRKTRTRRGMRMTRRMPMRRTRTMRRTRRY